MTYKNDIYTLSLYLRTYHNYNCIYPLKLMVAVEIGIFFTGAIVWAQVKIKTCRLSLYRKLKQYNILTSYVALCQIKISILDMHSDFTWMRPGTLTLKIATFSLLSKKWHFSCVESPKREYIDILIQNYPCLVICYICI